MSCGGGIGGKLRASSGRAQGELEATEPVLTRPAEHTRPLTRPRTPHPQSPTRLVSTIRVYVCLRVDPPRCQSTDLLSFYFAQDVFYFAQDVVFLSLMPRPLHRPGPHTRSHPVLLSLYFREFSYILWKQERNAERADSLHTNVERDQIQYRSVRKATYGRYFTHPTLLCLLCGLITTKHF